MVGVVLDNGEAVCCEMWGNTTDVKSSFLTIVSALFRGHSRGGGDD
jgi:hypothetical protein